MIGPEHARTIAGKGWTRHDVRSYLHMNAWNLFRELAFDHRYGHIYNRNLPRWYRRELGLAHPDRAEPRPYPSVRDRRRGRPLLGLYPRLGPHDRAGAAQHRRQRLERGAGLRRRDVLFVSMPGSALPVTRIDDGDPGSDWKWHIPDAVLAHIITGLEDPLNQDCKAERFRLRAGAARALWTGKRSVARQDPAARLSA